MACPERVAFGLSLASSSSELMIARMTSIESSSPQSQWRHSHANHCHFHRFHRSCQLLPCCHFVSIKYLFSSATRFSSGTSFLSLVTSPHSSIQGLSSHDLSFISLRSLAFSSPLFFLFKLQHFKMLKIIHHKL